MYKLELENGKYTIIEDLNKGKFEALRYGDEWRNLGAEGDNLILALVYKVQELEEIVVKQAEELDNIDIAKMIKERESNDNGIRYTLEEVKKMREEIKESDDNIYYEVEIHNKNGSIDKQYHIKNPEDDIVVCYDDKTSTKEENIYLITLDNKEIYLDINDIIEIYLNQIEEGYTEDRYMFWMNLNL